MLYLLGVNHKYQNNYNGNKDKLIYSQFLGEICKNKSVKNIFEEWPNGTQFPSITPNILENLKIRYYQIDLQEEKRLYSKQKCKNCCQKKKEMYIHREKNWIKEIEKRHTNNVNSLLIAGSSHIINNVKAI